MEIPAVITNVEITDPETVATDEPSAEVKKKWPNYVGFPNDLANDDPGSFHQSEAIRFLPPEPDGSGAYNQINFLISLYDRIERNLDRWDQLQAQRTMRRGFDKDSGIRCSQKAWKKHSPMLWDDGLPDEWWRERPSLTIYDLALEDELAAHELATGQWE